MAQRADVLTMKQARAMVSMFRGEKRTRDAALVACAAGFGLRAGDTCSLRWTDVLDSTDALRTDLTLKEQKTKQTRVLRVLPFVADVLIEWRKEAPAAGEWIFPGQDGGPLDRRSMWVIVSEAADRMGLKGTISPHSLRKAFCDYMYNLTHDPVLTARITGHTNPAQLMRYIGRMADVEAGIWDRAAADLK
jgi:integrase/recombinase XerD